MSNRRVINFNQKGFTKNFLQIMKTKEQQNECCTDFLTGIFTQNTDTVILTGDGTENNPLTATGTLTIGKVLMLQTSNTI